MQPPGGEGVAKGLARHERGEQRGGEGGRRDAEVAGGLQYQESHGEGPADDGHGQGAHAHQGRDRRIERQHADVQHPQAHGVGAAQQRAEEQRGEEQPAAEAEPQRHDRGGRLQHQQDQHHLQPRPHGQVLPQGAVAGRQGLGRVEGERDQDQAAERGPQQFGQGRLARHPLHQGRQPHHRDAERGRHQPEAGVESVGGVGHDRAERLRRHAVDLLARGARHQGAGQGRGRHRRHARDGVGPDDDLEGVEGAGQGRAEGRGDGRPGSGPHQQAQVRAPQVQPHPEPRGDRPAHLGVGRLQPHRGAEAVGDQGLQRDVEALAQRHAPAPQRVGLHRVHHRGGTAAGPGIGDGAEQQPADRDRQQPHRRDRRRHRQAHLRLDAEQRHLRGVGHDPHGHGHGSGQRPDDQGDEHQPQLAGADLGPKPGQGATGRGALGQGLRGHRRRRPGGLGLTSKP